MFKWEALVSPSPIACAWLADPFLWAPRKGEDVGSPTPGGDGTYPVLPRREVRDSGSRYSVHNRESLWFAEPIRAGLFLLRLFYFWVLVSQGLGLFSLGSEGEGPTFDAETSWH